MKREQMILYSHVGRDKRKTKRQFWPEKFKKQKPPSCSKRKGLLCKYSKQRLQPTRHTHCQGDSAVRWKAKLESCSFFFKDNLKKKNLFIFGCVGSSSLHKGFL